MTATTPREIADEYVERIADLNPITGTALGIRPGDARLPDFSPHGQAALDELARTTLAALDTAGEQSDPLERRCDRLLRNRLDAALALSDAGEHLRSVSTIGSPLHGIRGTFLMMPAATDDDWAVIARRLDAVPASVHSYQEALEGGLAQGLSAAPRQIEAVAEQLDEWVSTAWFTEFAGRGPDALRADLERAAGTATEAMTAVREYLRGDYQSAAAGTPDAVGAERYARFARYWTGADLDLAEAYDWGWQEFFRLDGELRREADVVRPGSTPAQAMAHLDREGEAVDGVEAIRERLQLMMDTAIAELDSTHFDLAEPVRRVEAMIAPPGSAAAPYYTRPSLDFARPGRTWLPTLGRTRFPLWNLISTWYHEGVPGHHLQLAQWVHVAPQLSRFQTSLGSTAADTEGWALYAERLMDELGYLTAPGARLGYLDVQQLRAVRVVIDIGMHLELDIPSGQPFHPGERWTPELGREFLGANSGMDTAFADSELVRYLGIPGQAISYKLGERAWLAGRAAAERRRGSSFDLKAWHMAALSMGSLGLDDLTAELAAL